MVAGGTFCLSSFFLFSGKSLYDYNDEDFVNEDGWDPLTAGGLVPLQERARKKNYNENEYYREQQQESRSSGPRIAKPKSIQVWRLARNA